MGKKVKPPLQTSHWQQGVRNWMSPQFGTKFPHQHTISFGLKCSIWFHMQNPSSCFNSQLLCLNMGAEDIRYSRKWLPLPFPVHATYCKLQTVCNSIQELSTKWTAYRVFVIVNLVKELVICVKNNTWRLYMTHSWSLTNGYYP